MAGWEYEVEAEEEVQVQGTSYRLQVARYRVQGEEG